MTSVLFLFTKIKTHNLLLEMLGNQDKSRVKMSKIIDCTYTQPKFLHWLLYSLTAMGKAKYLLPAMHPKYLLKFFQFFLENWVFVDIIQYIPVDGLQRRWRQETAIVTIHCLF